MRVWLPALRAHSGVDVFVRRLARALERAGAQATITWFPSHAELLPFLLGHTAPPPGTRIVHANSWLGHAFRRDGLPLVVTQHSASVRDRDWTRHASLAQRAYYALLVRRWEARSLAAAAAVTAVSRHVRESLERAYGATQARVIPHWVDTTTFTPVAGPRAPGPFRLLFVGNLTRRKGADVMLETARRLGPAFELRFVGLRQGPRAGLPGNVRYSPPVATEEAMADLYRWCDVLLVTSRSEGFGYAPLEALACARPVVASRAGALPEVIRDGETGLLCDPGDVDAFVRACRALATDAARLRRMGEAARQDATTRFSESAAASAYLDVYRSVST